MKKYLLSLLTLTLLFCEASFTGGGMAFAANKVGDTFTYNISGGGVLTCTITKVYTSSSNYGEAKIKVKTSPTSSISLTLPTTLNLTWSGDASKSYYDITAVEDDGFLDQTLITSINTSSKIKTIGARAFKGCSNITSVTIGAPVTSIGANAFEGCSNLRSINWNATGYPNCTSTTSTQPFYNIRTQITSITFSINSAFTSIPNYLCNGMTGLTSINIPRYVTSIGAYSFNGCSNLTSVTWNPENYTSSFSSSTAPFRASNSTITSFSFGSYVTKIPAQLCYGMSQITSVTIPQTVTQVGNGAFLGCNGLTTVTWNAASCADFAYSMSGGIPTYSSPFINKAASSPSGAEVAQHITKITFGSNVTHIPAYLCYYMDHITSVTIPSKVTSIGEGAFGSCSLLKEIKWEAGSATIGSGAWGSAVKHIVWNKTNCADFASADATPFYSIRTSIKSFSFKNNVTLVPAYLCDGMTNLKRISLPASITTVGANAFNDCTAMEYFSCAKTTAATAAASSFTNVPCCLTVFADAWDSYKDATGWNHFNNAGCSNAASDIASGVCGAQGDNLIWTLNLSTGALTISGTGEMATYSSSGNTSPWTDYKSSISSLTIEDGVTSIGAYAFYNHSTISDVTIPSSVITFNSSAFSGCSALDKATGGSLNFLGTADQWASINFASSSANPIYCNHSLKLNGTTLVNATLNTDVKGYCFYGNTDLETITLGDNVTYVGTYAFNNSGVTTINCSSTTPLDSIASYAFNNCSSLNDITLPGTLRKVMSSAFGNNTALTPEGGNLNFLGTADQWASISFSSYLYNPTYQCQSLKLNGIPLETCTISVNVTSGNFYRVKSLRSVSFNEGCETIAASAFYECSNLDGELVFPSTLTSIGNNAFQGAAGIDVIYALPTTPPAISSYTFQGIDKATTPLCVPISAASTYGSTALWQDFTIWYGGLCGAEEGESNLRWRYNPTSHVLYISGLGAMKNYTGSTAMPWNSFKTSITSLVIEDGVTTIGNYAFYGCTGLNAISLPTSLTTIGNYVFYNDAALTSVTIPEGVTNLGNCIFQNATSLATISLPSTLLTIGYNAFMANALTSVSIPASVTTIGSSSFKNCSSLASVSFVGTPSLTSFAYSLFEGCSKLTSITIPNSVTAIDHDAFSGCSKLASVTYGSNPTLASIGYSAFKNCTELTSITIPDSITTITGNNGTTPYTPFAGCSKLTTVVWNARNCGGYTPINYNNSIYYQMPFEAIKTQIESLTFGEEVERIPDYLCHGMTNITSLTIPASVTSIGTNSFNGCTGLASVTSEATTPQTIGASTFSSLPSTKKLYLPHNIAAKAAYRAASGWSSFGEANTFPKIVQFDLNGQTGDAIDPLFFDNITSKASAPGDPADVNYHSFSGWYENPEGTGSEFAFSTTNITEDKTLYAKWTIYNYQVTFDLQGHGASIPAQTIDHNGLVSKPSDPSAEYYTFGGWYKEAGCSNAWDFSEDHITAATTLYAKWTRADLTLNDNADNSDALTEYDTETTNVHLARSLISASYNTICLPFAMTAAQVESAFGAECDIEELTRASCADGNLKLFFTKRTAIEAGKPYLIQPKANVANPTIAGVTIDNTSRPSEFEGVTFTGIFSPTVLADSENLLFVGASNTLYMSSGGTMKGMRAYFELTTPGSLAAARRSARIILHEEGATGIEETITNDQSPITNKIIRDGQLFILRDGKTYNAQGALIK